MGLFDVLTDIVKNVKNKNRENPDVRTADKSVFDDLTDKFKDLLDKKNEPEVKPTAPKPRTTVPDVPFFYEDLVKKVDEAKRENETNPEVETADKSVYDDLMGEIENLKRKLAEQENEAKEKDLIETTAKNVSETTTTHQNVETNRNETKRALVAGMQATTNSFGGSLQMRMNPDMAAATNSTRIPDKSLITILEISDKSIHLDGQVSYFVLVDYQGQQGWLLDSYLF